MITTERESTIYARVSLDPAWGNISDITEQMIAAMPDPDERPDNWVTATLVTDGHDLYRDEPELAVLIGPPEADDERSAELRHTVGPTDEPADYQLWVAIGTSTEWIVQRVGTWEVT